jgi:glycosyltransferase involved in cell wall biosynthesis
MAKPAVATVAIKSSDMIVDGVTGRLAAPEDPTGLAEAMLTVLQDEELARNMGEAAYRHLGLGCSGESYARRIEELFRAVLDHNVEALVKRRAERLLDISGAVRDV